MADDPVTGLGGGRRRALLTVPYVLFVLVIPISLVADAPPVIGALFGSLQLAGLITNIAAARTADRSAAARTWWLMALGFGVLVMTGIAFVQSDTTGSDRPMVGGHENWLLLAITLRIVFALIMLAALLSLSTGPRAVGSRWRQGLDTTTVLGGGVMATWYFILGPVVSRSGTVNAASYFYAFLPLADLALVIGVSAVLLRGAGPAGRRPLLLLLAGALCFGGADVSFAVLALNPDLYLAVHLRNLVQIVPQMFVVAAATEACRQGSGGRFDALDERPLRPVTWLPYLALAVGFGLLAVAARGDLYPWIGLVGGAILMTASVATRQFLVLRENRALAATDALTGLANRIRLREVLADLERLHRHHRRDFAVLVVDLDDFKPVNDTLGHEAGDTLLVHFAHVLRQIVPSDGIAARLGGDEFALVVPEIDGVAEATRVAERLLQALEAPFDVLGHRVRVRASIGVAASIGLEVATDLPHRADLAMYEAKKSPSSGWRLHGAGGSGDGPDSRDGQLALRDEMVDAVETGRLAVVYQPVVELAGGTVVEVEALVRWPHPTRGLLLPKDFLPVAEQAGVSTALDLWVLGAACRQVLAWREQPEVGELRLATNFFAGRLARPGAATAILGVLDDTGFDPHHLTLELTGAAPTAGETALTQLDQLHRRGIRIVLDGFAAGPLSLEHLRWIPFDAVKLDPSVIAGLGSDRAAAPIARAVAQLARELEVDAVAVGLETREHLQFVAEFGYAYGQGHLLAGPRPPAELAPLLGLVLCGPAAGRSRSWV